MINQFFLIFSLSFFQEIVFFIPSSVVQIYSGFIVMDGYIFNLDSLIHFFIFMILPSTLGMLLGSVILFIIIKKFGILFKLNLIELNKMSSFFSYPSLIFITRSIPMFSNTVVTVFSSLTTIRLKTFIIWSFLGLLIRSFIQGIIGWTGISIYHNGFIDSFKIIFILINILVIVSITYYIIKKNKNV